MIEELINTITPFFETYGLWIAAGSVAMFVISIASMPSIVAQIPADYFTHHGRHRMSQSNHHPVIRLLLAGLKNILGAILLVAGFIMLFTPGQGVLAILFGLMIMNYPGKYRLECWIIGKPAIFNAVNTMRAKQNKEPLLPPEPHSN
jgi:archaellum biogenesis protein FlaJ (TadC family)